MADGTSPPMTVPFLADLADGPADGRAVWLHASDGVRIRVAIWGENSVALARKGTVLLFPGRTEYVEKYGRAAGDMLARGYVTVAIDWRGQGLADRLLANRAIGHVDRFLDYQHDVAAVVDFVRAAGLPGPYFLLGHSMGGCIGLRALYEGLPVAAAAFSGPIWGIQITPHMRPVAWTMSTLWRSFGFGGRRTPGQIDDTYVLRAPFEGNALTTDEPHWQWMQSHLRAAPDLALGGASLGWLNEALREMRALSRMRSPDLPCLTAVGSRETIVDMPRIHSRMAIWPKGELLQIDGAEHEIMMETPATRALFYDRIADLFAAAA